MCAGMFQDFQLQAGLKTYPGGLPLFKPRVWVEPQTSFNTFQDSFVTLFGLMVRASCARWPQQKCFAPAPAACNITTAEDYFHGYFGPCTGTCRSSLS